MSIKSENNHLTKHFLFGKKNYMFMFIGLAIMVLGYILMSGGKNAPTEWDESKVYSTTRIVVAPILVLLGLVVEIYAIFVKPKEDE